jgi:hypothetical protein
MGAFGDSGKPGDFNACTPEFATKIRFSDFLRHWSEQNQALLQTQSTGRVHC